jgi:hypothetical protein
MERIKFMDLIEDRFYESVKKGEQWAIALGLKTLCKNRGYVERQEHRLGGDKKAPPIEAKRNYVNVADLELPLEVKRIILAALEKREAEEKGTSNGARPVAG